MWIDLGCNVEVLGFKVKNTHNSIMNDFSTKNMLVTMIQWPSWKKSKLLNTSLQDSRNKVKKYKITTQ